jgi:hypothetical protein
LLLLAGAYISGNTVTQGETMTREFFPSAVALLLPMTLSTAVLADEPPQANCTTQTAPTGELSPWSAPIPLAAAGEPQRLPALAVGQAANLTLLQTPQVRYPLRPDKPSGSASYGGLVGITIAQAGTYRVALSSGAWVDLVRDGKAVTSVAHGHGPACTGVHKMVDFPLMPGRYTLQFDAIAEAKMRVLVARLP